MVNQVEANVFISPENLTLNHEGDLSDEELLRRQAVGEQILKFVPPEALESLQIFQPAIGCVNRCNFCSQLAGPVARELDADSLQTIFGGIKGAMSQLNLNKLGGDRGHKPGVIFPYLDNDIGSYPHLLEFVDGMASLGTKTRLSTVGWSRHNSELQRMHEAIANNHIDHVDGIRFSLTPYTYGWRTNHEDYIHDFANAIETYKPFIEANGASRRTGCVELRFKPDISLAKLEVETIDTYKVIRCNEYALVTIDTDSQQTFIQDMDEGKARLSSEGVDAINIIGDTQGLDKDTIDTLFATLDNKKEYQAVDNHFLALKGKGHTFTNDDGEYYCFNPLKTEDGFNAVHYYPATDKRAQAGMLDATRPFLNTLIAHKNAAGYEINEDIPNATDDDVQALLEDLESQSEKFAPFSPRRAEYIRTQVLPIVKDAAEVIARTTLGSAYFFKYGFLTDTGVIVNQGKAVSEFQGLVSRGDMPLTPNEEKGYGSTSQSSVRGITWRIAPVETVPDGGNIRTYGQKSLPLIEANGRPTPGAQDKLVQLGFFALNPEAFTTKAPDGSDLPAIYVPLPEGTGKPLRKVTPSTGQAANLFPGSVKS